MADYLQGDAYQRLRTGPLVVKTAQTLPSNTTLNLFTVSTGNVMVTSLYGVITTPTTATTFTLALGNKPTTGTAHTSAIATAVAAGTRETGTWLTTQVSSGIGGALVVGTDGGTVLFKPAEFTLAPGNLTWTTSAAAQGAVTWYLAYVPLDPGAYVS